MTGIRVALWALATAFAHPRVLLAAYVVVTAAAAWLVWPVWAVLDAELAAQPGSGFLLDGVLDADFARRHPDTVLRLGGASAVVLASWALLGGGVLATVGLGRKLRFSELLSEGGAFLLRSLRVLGIGLVLAVLLAWGLGAVDRLLAERAWRDADPGVVTVFGWVPAHWCTRALALEALRWLWGLAFLVLLFTSKVALARLVVDGRRSAFLAWAHALGMVARRPWRPVLITGVLVAAWMLGSFVLGFATARLLERDRNLVAGLVLTQVQVLFAQGILIAFLLAARRFLVLGRGTVRESREPVVVIPQRAPAPAATPQPAARP
jgi:hypothetical protein